MTAQGTDEVAAAAAKYLLDGALPFLVPIPRGSKGPRSPGWNLRENCISNPADAATLTGHNMGVPHLYTRTCALDVDAESAAVAWLQSHGIDLAALCNAPDALQIRSGRKGRGKLLYRLPEGVEFLPTIQPAGSGLELRCANRDGTTTVQDVLPPSIHPDTGKPYRWDGKGHWSEPPVLPKSLLHLWQTLAARGSVAADPQRDDDGHVPEGGRNVYLTQRAGALRRAGLEPDEIDAALQSINLRECTPALDADEVSTIARSVGKYTAPPERVLSAEAEVDRLAALSPLAYEAERNTVAKALCMRASVLDAAVRAKRPEARTDDSEMLRTFGIAPTPAPSAEPADPAALFAELETLAQRYVSLPPHAPTAVALWVAWTYVFDHRDFAPILAILSATLGCGKSTLLQLVAKLANRSFETSNATASTIFRMIEMVRPTLLLDEADTFATGENEALRGIINSGHHRAGARVVRTEGDGANRRVESFSTWAPKVVAAIGSLPATVESRSIIVRLQRKPAAMRLPRLGRAEFTETRARLARWAADHSTAVAVFDYGEAPDWLGDRAFDSWEPLLAVAATAGPEWIARAERATQALSGSGAAVPTNAADGITLLRDIRAVWPESDPHIASELLAHLLADDESLIWGEYLYGKKLTVRQLAALLRPFGISPGTVRVQGKTPKGYTREKFQDLWSRYLES